MKCKTCGSTIKVSVNIDTDQAECWECHQRELDELSIGECERCGEIAMLSEYYDIGDYPDLLCSRCISAMNREWERCSKNACKECISNLTNENKPKRGKEGIKMKSSSTVKREFLTFLYGGIIKKWKEEGHRDDRGIACNMYDLLIEALEELEGIKNISIVCAFNPYYNTQLTKIGDIVKRFVGKEREYIASVEREVTHVKRIDDLGRIHIPKELRKKLEFPECGLAEVCIVDGEIRIKKPLELSALVEEGKETGESFGECERCGETEILSEYFCYAEDETPSSICNNCVTDLKNLCMMGGYPRKEKK